MLWASCHCRAGHPRQSGTWIWIRSISSFWFQSGSIATKAPKVPDLVSLGLCLGPPHRHHQFHFVPTPVHAINSEHCNVEVQVFLCLCSLLPLSFFLSFFFSCPLPAVSDSIGSLTPPFSSQFSPNELLFSHLFVVGSLITVSGLFFFSLRPIFFYLWPSCRVPLVALGPLAPTPPRSLHSELITPPRS